MKKFLKTIYRKNFSKKSKNFLFLRPFFKKVFFSTHVWLNLLLIGASYKASQVDWFYESAVKKVSPFPTFYAETKLKYFPEVFFLTEK